MKATEGPKFTKLSLRESCPMCSRDLGKLELEFMILITLWKILQKHFYKNSLTCWVCEHHKRQICKKFLER